MDAHKLIAALKNMAIELGRTPTRNEFCPTIRNGRILVTEIFGGYSALVIAAGLEPAKHASKKLTNEIFRRDIELVLQDYEPRAVTPTPKYTPTLVIGDTHFPFVSERTLAAIYEFAGSHRPKRIIQVGDLYDMYAHTKFPRSHNIYTPKEEEALARKGAEEMWRTLLALCPEADCVQLKGNHDIRPLKRTLEVAPALEHWVGKYLDDLMTFPDVTLITDSRQEYIVEGIEFIHGHYSGIGRHRDYALMNAVCGHQHKGGVLYRRIRGQTLWELNAGLVGDPESKALAYTPQKIHDCTPGFGWIDEFGPRFIAV